MMYKLNRFSDAVTYLDRATKADPKNKESFFALGTAQHKAGNLAGARAAFQKAIEIDSTYADALYEMGDVEYAIANFDGAIANFTKVVEEHPTYGKCYLAYYQLGKIYVDKNDHKTAAEMFGKAAEKKPSLAEAHFMQGKSLAKIKSNDAAIRALRAATALKDPYGVAHYELARIYQTLQSFESALKEYKAAAADPEFSKKAQANKAARQIQEYLDKLAKQQSAMEEEEEYDDVDDIPRSDFEP